MYVLTRVFLFYLRSGQPELFTNLDFHSLSGIAGDLSAYLVIYISVLLFCCQLCISGLLCIWDLMSYLLSDRYYVFCIWFWDFVIVASWTTMVFLFPLRVILIFLCLWFYDCFHLLQFYLQCGILSNSSPTCVDANGWKYRLVIVGIRALVLGKP